MPSRIYIFLTTLFLLFHFQGFAQEPLPALSSAEIQHKLNHLNVLGSVLYVAAHPDDENTRLISYLAKGKGYRTAYLALTRGDGGQNLIGDEKGTYLGILRTQELLAARRIDGGEQMFSRAYDFGYSKTPEETLQIWDEEEVLADVVWAIRKFRPDVIITRFATPEKGGGGHGHHTSSAILAHKAFEIAGDKEAFPEQLEFVQPWQPKRLLWNNYWVFRRYEPTEEDLKNILSVDVGQYDPLLGKSYGEIAGEARSMHKCQAFGTARYRGELIEYLDHELGDRAENDLFDDIDATWNRVDGGKKIQKLISEAIEKYDPQDPQKSIPLLVQAYSLMDGKQDPWIVYKKEVLSELIMYCAGLWFEVNTPYPIVSQGDSVTLEIEYLRRNTYPVKLNSIQFPDFNETLELNKEISLNGKVNKLEKTVSLSRVPVTQPYWLREVKDKGMFNVEDQELIGLPESYPSIQSTFCFEIDETEIPVTIPVVHRYVDRAVGELYRPFIVSPKVTVNLAENVYVFSGMAAQELDLQIKCFASKANTVINFEVPQGWKVSPPRLSFDFMEPGEEKSTTITVTPPAYGSVGKIKARISVNEEESSFSQRTIAYDHIPTQMVFPEASANLVKIDLQKRGEKIGYIMGSGDEIPKSLHQMGYQVDLLSDDQITADNLEQYDAVIAGIRAYNRRKRLPYLQDAIFEYVNKGGTYIVQYNTTYDLSTKQPAPYPLTISRERVTDEESDVIFLKPEHSVLNFPNKITDKDFDNWIQERGLYFPASWDEKYEAILRWNDEGESPKEGGLLVANYGEGHFIYTGISFFRELPAGVPGAYRLLANMISIGKQ